MPRPKEMPAEVPDHWLVYFGTEDVDAQAKQATEKGATIIVQPTEIPGTGRFAVLLDPQGAVFALFKS
jgi:predicted enzyme related to lactoylglutathione lyase